ncbi:GARP complex subunit Vps53 [Schizosaccharomyces pombe]
MSNGNDNSLIIKNIGNNEFKFVETLHELLPEDITYDDLGSLRLSLSERLQESVKKLDANKKTYEDAKLSMGEKMDDLNSSIVSLLQDLSTLQSVAENTQSSIVQMTSEIKNLDFAKQNLATSMTMLKRLQMLVTAYEKLRTLRQNQKFGEAISLMQATLQLLNFFKKYRSVERIASLSRSISEFQKSFYEQVFDTFQSQFKKESGMRGGFSPSSVQYLNELCRFIDIFAGDPPESVIRWYCRHQLEDFMKVFRENEEAGSLENLPRRYTWFKKLLQTYDQLHKPIFPPHWKVDFRLYEVFCEETKNDLSKLLKDDRLSLQVFVASLEQTLEFESFIDHRFYNTKSRFNSNFEPKERQAYNALSSVFEPHYTLYFNQQSQEFSILFENFALEKQTSTDESSQVLSSSIKLFQAYRKTLTQFVRLTRSSPLVGLKNLFIKWLRRYTQVELLDYQESSTFKDIAIRLNTAEYIYRTTIELEKRFQEISNKEFKDKMSFSEVLEVISSSRGTLLKFATGKFENVLNSDLEPLSKMDLKNIETVGDQSSYVGGAVQNMTAKASEFLSVVDLNMFARNFCDRSCESFTRQFLNAIYLAKPISEVGAEQLLLDLYSFKNALLKLPDLKQDYSITDSYINHLTIFMGYIETVLKTLLTPASPKAGFIQSYIFLVKDRSVTNFTVLLELKGVGKSDISSFLQQFSDFVKKTPQLEESSPIFKYLTINTAVEQAATRSRLSLDLAPESSRTLQNLGRLFTSKKKHV